MDDYSDRKHTYAWKGKSPDVCSMVGKANSKRIRTNKYFEKYLNPIMQNYW